MSFAKKKLAELELSLNQLQENLYIPKINLRIHADILRVVSEAEALHLRPKVEDLGTLANDPIFLNKIQSDVNSWVKEIQKVTHLERDVNQGSASHEVDFWIQMDTALAHIELELKSSHVTLTLDALKSAKRFHATTSFIADTGIKEACEKVSRYNQLMKEFPIQELLSSTDLPKIRDSISIIFTHINKKLRLAPYPIARALPLVGAISRDMNIQIHKVIGPHFFSLDYTRFDIIIESCMLIFKTWDDNLKEFINVAREMTRKRSVLFD